MTVEIRRASARFVERGEGVATQHSFAFGAVYDPARTAFGPMVCHDDHLLGSGRGFDAHRHADLEIVTWPVEGAVTHTDSLGSSETIEPGSVGVLSAGSGVEHAETASAPGVTRFVQVWLTPDETGTEPSYAVATPTIAPGALVAVAGEGSSVPLGVAGARFSVARLHAGSELVLPAAPRMHVFVAAGALVRSSLAEPLGAGDAFEMLDEPSYAVTAAVPTELLVWTFA